MSRYFRNNDQTALTEAERLILNILLLNPDIRAAARALKIKERTADNRLRVIREKFNVTNTSEAVALWRERQMKAVA